MRDRRLPLVAVVAALLAPLAVTAVRLVLDDAPNPGGDHALIELRVRDVGADTPLTGSYGRYGFNHPGPLWFVALALPYRLAGSTFVGLQLGALALSAVAVVAIAVVALRRGGIVGLLWSGLLVGLLLRGLGPAWVADPWEPHALTVACAALLVLTFDAVAGRARTLPLVVVSASLLAQAQATLLTFAVALAAAATVAVLRRPGGSRPVLVAACAALVLWAPPLVEELRAGTGNVTAMVRSLRDAPGTLGVGDAARAVALEVGHRPSWIGFEQPLEPFAATVDVGAAPLVPVGLVAVGLAAVAAWRRRATEALILAGVVALGVVTAVVSLARLVGPLFAWIPSWTAALGFGCWLAAGWCIGGRPLGRFGTPILAVAMGAVALAGVVDAVMDDHRRDPLEAAVRQLASEGAAVVDRAVVLVRSDVDADLVFGGGSAGLETLVLELERRGVEVVVARDLAYRFGDHRAEPERATAELRLVESPAAVPEVVVPVADVDPLTAEQRRERATLLERFRDGASPADRIRAAADDPTLRPALERLLAIPDLPRLALVHRRLP